MKPLLIMAGGASSRMKRSLQNSTLTNEQKEIAQHVHKSLIPLGKEQKPLLYHLISNAVASGYTDVYLITSPQNQAFKEHIGERKTDNSYAGAKIHFAIQYLKEGYEKPLGTADAVLQALDQYPELLEQTFAVCNGDNLYSKDAFKILLDQREAPHALISYARSGLQFSNERIQKFAVLDIDDEGFLNNIIEKPDSSTIEQYKDNTGEIFVSMNIFSFLGNALYPFLESCPIHPDRKEKELPEALRRLTTKTPKQIQCFGRKEHLLDLTAAEDIQSFNIL